MPGSGDTWLRGYLTRGYLAQGYVAQLRQGKTIPDSAAP